jgi:exodeoxyribonuclease-5
MITLTAEQDAAIEAARQWYAGAMSPGERYPTPPKYGDREWLKMALGEPQYEARIATPPFRLFGPAGTGKTTLARHIGRALGLGNVVFGAYTGKAASVLNRKGVPATTIHSAIYQPVFSAETRKRWLEAMGELQQMRGERAVLSGVSTVLALELDGAISERSEEVEQLEREMRRPGFELNPMSEWASADLIVLDEVSMVDAKMAADIESFGVPVLVLGDPAQLPPVGGMGYYTDAEPDVLLTEIHRQALESPVLELATRIRLSTDATLGVRPEELGVASVTRALEAEQVLCWRNETRWKLTGLMRAKLGRPAGKVVAGDRIMCLVNNKRDLGVLNGQQFDVLDVSGITDELTLLLRECGTAGPDRWISVFPEGFAGLDGEKSLKDRRAFRGTTMAATWACCVTVHKAQGSEWSSVYVVDETPAMMAMTARREGERAAVEMARRFAYTAVTRAQESVTLARTRS